MTTLNNLTFDELLGYTAGETEKWRQWLATQAPEVLEIPAGTGRTATVRGLIHHIIVVERRYTDRLRGEPVSKYEDIPADPIEKTFEVWVETRRRLKEWLATATDAQLSEMLEFQTLTAGTQKASARKVVVHALLHGLRHWAQLATIVREHGHPTDWFHDILMSDALN
jgi:uncharacterized damage-inducible protein DinB